MATFRQRKVARQLAAPGGVVHRAVSVVTFAAEAEAKRRAPYRFGVLSNSIKGEVNSRGARVRGTVGSNVEYAAANEFGSHSAGEPDAPGKKSYAAGGLAPRPYLRPGLTFGVAFARRKGLIR